MLASANLRFLKLDANVGIPIFPLTTQKHHFYYLNDNLVGFLNRGYRLNYQTINEISNVSMPYRFHLHRLNP